MRKFTIKSLSLLVFLLIALIPQQVVAQDETYDFQNFISSCTTGHGIVTNGEQTVTIGENVTTISLLSDFTQTNYNTLRNTNLEFLCNSRFAISGSYSFHRNKWDTYRVRCTQTSGYFCVLNLNVGDVLTFTTNNGTAGEMGDIKFISTNAKKSGSSTDVQEEESLESGVSYEITKSGRLDFMVGNGSGFQKIVITPNPDVEIVTNPIISITAAKGEARTITISGGSTSKESENIVGYKYTVDGTDPNTNGIDYTEPFDVSEKCSIKAIAISSSGANSVVTSFEADAGYFISLPSPKISMSGLIKISNDLYQARFIASIDTKDIYGNESGAKLSYSFISQNGESENIDMTSGYTVSEKGTLKVTATAEGYSSSTSQFDVYGYYNPTYSSQKYNEITEEDIAAVLGENWTKQNETGRWSGWSENGVPYTYYAHTGGSGSVWNYTIDNLQLRSVVQLNIGGGLGRNSNESDSYLKNLANGQLGVIYMFDGTLKSNYYQLYFIGDGKNQRFYLDAGDVIQQVVFYTGVEDETASISTAGYATFSSTYAVDFSAAEGLTAYTATVSDNKVVMTPIENGIVPANTGVILKGAAGDYTGVITTTEAVIENNDLVAATEEIASLATETTVDEVTYKNYILNVVNETPGFYQAAGKKVAAGKAYLQVPVEQASSAKTLTIVWNDGETTGIKDNYEFGIMNSDAATYDLSGRKVANPAKGLYIKNGKKFIVK
ncbi:MAG: chitobiase/beta-hexosaminidase C-terminal domain-containing protein [Prevotella sp.]|nr:chitobiase/beta-hexosaminidase C-terminal domain-containing protein [Prevotella sp.]